MTVLHRFVSSSAIQTVGSREFRGIAATSNLQSDGYALDMAGANLSRFRSGQGPLIDNHVPTDILGVVTSISTTATTLPFSARFASAGVSSLADQRCRELKDGVVNCFSVGFMIDESVPMDPRRPNGARKATKWTLLEISLANTPVDPKAVVTARSRRAIGAAKAALAHAEQALDEHRAAGRHTSAMADSLQRLDEHRRHAGTALRAYRAALESGDEPQVADAHARCRRCLEGMGRELRAIGDRHEDATDAHSSLMRAFMKAQTSAGFDDSGDTDDDNQARARRRREVEYLLLAAEADSEDIDDVARRRRQVEVLELAALAE